MTKKEIIDFVKRKAFDAIVMAFKAKNSYYERMDAICNIILEANEKIEMVKKNG